MKILSKFIGLAFLLAVFSGGVNAKTLKFATLAPAGTTWMKEMKAGAKQIKQRTEGRVKIKFYPGGVMGNDESVLRKIPFKFLIRTCNLQFQIQCSTN